MEVLAVLKQAINACTSVVKWGAGHAGEREKRAGCRPADDLLEL